MKKRLETLFYCISLELAKLAKDRKDQGYEYSNGHNVDFTWCALLKYGSSEEARLTKMQDRTVIVYDASWDSEFWDRWIIWHSVFHGEFRVHYRGNCDGDRSLPIALHNALEGKRYSIL